MLIMKHQYNSPLPQKAELFLQNLFDNPPAEANEYLANIAMCILNGFTWLQHPGNADQVDSGLIVYDNKAGKVIISEEPTQKETTNDNPDRNTSDKQLHADAGTTDDAPS